MNIHEHRFNGQRDCCRTVILQFCGAAAAMQTHMRDTHVRIPSIYTHIYTHTHTACFDGLLSGDVRCVAKATFCNYVLGRNVLALAGGRH